MLNILSTFLISLAVSFLVSFEIKRRLKWRKYNLPPSLPNIPIIGSIPFLPSFATTHYFFLKEMKKRGPIIGFHIFAGFKLVLNGKESIIEALQKNGHAFSDRPQAAANQYLNPNQKGIMFHPYNDFFKKYHKTALGIFKEFGFGSKVMENRINDEFNFLFTKLQNEIIKKKGEEFVFNPSYILANYSLNIICSILFGQRFDDDDKDLSMIVASVKRSFTELRKVFLFNIAPYLVKFPLIKNLLKGSIEVQEEIFELLNKKIVECSLPTTPTSFIGRMIEVEGEEFDKEQLQHSVHELFLAGTETSASTLEWALVLLANHRDVQERMVEEINMHVDEDKPISMDCKPLLKYCEATILELFRIKPVAPISLPHVTSCDAQLMGYDIPRNTMVLANIFSIHMDPDIWENPEDFNPNRFLNEDGDVINRDAILPFSIGKRSCFGEMLARQEIFLTVSSLVRKFIITPPNADLVVNVVEMMDVTMKPSSFNIAFAIRH